MYKIIVFTHGRLGEELIATSRLIMGEREDLESHALVPGCDLDELKETLLGSIRLANDAGRPALVLTDLMYGTPFNTMLALEGQADFRHITGTNLAILTEAVNLRDDHSLKEVMAELCSTGREGIMDADELIRRAKA